MTTPGLVSIAQADLDNWAASIESAVTTLQGIISSGNLTAADETAMTKAVSDLQAVAVPATPTPPPAPAGP